MSRQSTARRAVRKGEPCPICEREKSCSVGEDGLRMCFGRTGPQPGWVYLGQAKKMPKCALYRPEGDPLTERPCQTHPMPAPQQGAEEKKGGKKLPTDWRSKIGQARLALTAERKQSLAGWLLLPSWALDCIYGMGFHERDKRGGCWVWPEVDGEGEFCGMMRRWPNGDKWQMAGGLRGLTVNRCWEEMDGDLYLPEGMSDVVALAALGLAGIGRCSSSAGWDQLAEMLSGLRADRRIVVLGERDYREQTDTWPGRDGAVGCAQYLADKLRRPVSWAFPPAGKDVRDWTAALNPCPHEIEFWSQQGRRFVSGLHLHEIKPRGEEKKGGGLVLRTGSAVGDLILEWLVPDYLPEGEFVLFSGDGGEGKSFVTSHLAARLTRGEPVFGLNYPAGKPCDVLIANCEDDSFRTIKPRMRAAEADHSRWHLIEGTPRPDGTVGPFSMVHVHQIEQQLRANPRIRLVIIDPILGYLEGSNINPGRDEEVRRLLDPIRKILWDLRVTMILIKHFNKGLSPSTSARIADAAAWRNFCRASYQVFPHPDRPGVKALLCNKLQGAAEPEGQLYRLGNAPREVFDAFAHELPPEWTEEQRGKYARQVSLATWLGPTDLTDDECCIAQLLQKDDQPCETAGAADFLRKYLRTAPATASDCVTCGNVSCNLNRSREWWRDRILKRELGGDSAKARWANAPWYFCLPGQEPPAVAPV